ncbi:DEKNAAC104055 [Brettanomyces naardenensis]|uniref:Replication protein A subunit n=1 Tax=Brettanomyces naardenensis TaxID=13370 RepID=A0A448YQF9_BRENA|nr:DEKNAAC104055 [Brettanomyces naardenensis]
MDKITNGIILKVCKDGKLPPVLYLQAHQSKTITEPNGDRLRLMLNDGTYMINGVFKPNDDQSSIEDFKRYCILKITQYEITPTSTGKNFLVVDRAEVAGEGDKPDGKKFENVDGYFREHPEENYFLEKQKAAERNDLADTKHHSNGGSSNGVNVEASHASNSTSTPRNLYSIDQLSPYQNNWTIKARVSYKSDMRTWQNQRGEGKLFNVNFLDETGEIRATGFNAIAEKFYDLLKENKVYYVSKCAMQMAKPQFSNLKHQYELQFDRDTVIEECPDDADVPKLHFDLVKLDQVQNLDNGTVIDVIGVLKEVHEKQEIIAKSTGKPFDRRDVVIVDDTHFAVTVALWNKHARDFSLDVGTVVAFKGARVQDYGGKSLSLIPSATIVANPDIPEAYKLKGWYDSQGTKDTFKSIRSEGGTASVNLNTKESISARKTIKDAQDSKLGFSDKPDYFTLKATVTFVKTDNFSYPACQTEGCNRKVIEQADGTWRCEKCAQNFSEPNYRYILTISVVDQTGQLWMTLFDDQARVLVGLSAKELLKLKEESETNNSLKKYIQDNIAFNEYSFRIRARLDSYNGIDRARFNAVGLVKADFGLEADALVDELEGMGL